jgi:hypothetical protein
MADESTYLEDEREKYPWYEKPAPLEPITIKGYGTKMAVETGPGTGEYTNEWGEASTPEYVKDIDETISKYDTGEISDAQLRERGGMPQRPTERDLSRNDRWNEFWSKASKDMPDPQKEGQKAYDQYINNITSSFATSDLALKKPEEIMKWKQAASTVANAQRDRAQSRLQYEKTIARQEFDKEFDRQETLKETLRKEAAKRALEKTPWKLEDTETGLRQYIRVSPSGDVEIKPTNIPNVKDVVEPGDKPVEVARVRKMAIEVGQEPTATDISAIDKAANLIGMEYKKVTVPDPVFYNKNKTKEEWQLVPIGEGKGTETKAGAMPKVGEVMKGYRFKGGNPASKNSWERI